MTKIRQFKQQLEKFIRFKPAIINDSVLNSNTAGANHSLIVNELSSIYGPLCQRKEASHALFKHWIPLASIHEGKPAIIIGNGPSVECSDFLQFNNFVSFACNKFYMSYGLHQFRPDYTLVCDNQMLLDFGSDIISSCQSKPIFGVLSTVDLPFNPPPFSLPLIDFNLNDQVFSPVPFKGVSAMGSVVIMGIQLAFYMGCNPILIYGIDHNFNFQIASAESSKTKISFTEGNHFISGYREGRPWIPPKTEKIEAGFKLCSEYLLMNNNRLLNISHHSLLPSVERVAFEDAIRTFI